LNGLLASSVACCCQNVAWHHRKPYSTITTELL